MTLRPEAAAPGTAGSPGRAPRVAVVLTQLGMGGAERQTFELLRVLRGTPREPVLVVCMSDDLAPYGPALEEIGYAIHVLPRRSSFDLGRLRRLRRLLREHRIDVVHAVHLLASAYAHLATGGGRHPRVLPTVRGTVVRPDLVKGWIFRRMFARAPRTLVNSHRGAAFVVRNFGAPEDRVVVVPNGLDFAALARRADPPVLRRELGLDRAVPIVGFVGKDSRVKNVPRCLEIVRRLARDDGSLHAVLAGGGLDGAARARLAPDLAPERVHFLGPRHDLPAVLADFDLLLLTSDTEGSPNVVLEALALGVPVVSSDVGDVARLLPPGAGAVVPPPDVDAYVARAREVLAARDAARAAARAALPALEATFGLQAMVDATVALWDRISEWPPPSPR